MRFVQKPRHLENSLKTNWSFPGDPPLQKSFVSYNYYISSWAKCQLRSEEKFNIHCPSIRRDKINVIIHRDERNIQRLVDARMQCSIMFKNLQTIHLSFWVEVKEFLEGIDSLVDTHIDYSFKTGTYLL